MNERKELLIGDISAHVATVLKETDIHGIPVVKTVDRRGLNWDTEKNLAARQEKPDYSLIIAEMRALGPVTEIRIDNDHSFIIGSTAALDPHTYLRLPTQQVVEAFRNEHLSGMTQVQIDSLGLSANGLPAHIPQLDQGKPTYLPLHFVNWCFLEDRTAERPEYKPLDALSFYANGIGKLKELGCTFDDSEKVDHAMREALTRMTEISLRNRNVVAKLYNDHLLPEIVKAIVSLDDNKKDGEHKIVNITGDDRAQKIHELLTCNPHNQRVYCNIGHSSKDAQKEYDTGRGPATLEPWHNFTRYVPVDRFSMLIGKSQHGELNEEEYKDFKELIKAVSSVIPGMQNLEFVQKKKLEELGEKELSQFIKMIDPYSDYLAQYSVPVMSAVLEKCFDGHGDDIRVEQNEHMASATSLVASHGKSIKITVKPRERYDSMNDVEYGVAMMDKLYGPLQEFMGVYNATYQKIFDLAVIKDLAAEDIRKILQENLIAYTGILNNVDIDNLSKALAQLKPTTKMEDSRKSLQGKDSMEDVKIETDGRTRNEHILRNDLVVGILQALINTPELQHDLSHIIEEQGFDGTSLQNFFSTKNISLPTKIDKDDPQFNQRSSDVWNMALSDLQNNCFGQGATERTLPERIASRLVTAVEGLERRGQRTGVRSENIPRVPGLLISYRVRMNSDNEREFELELGISSGQRGAFEIATGGMLERVADQVNVLGT